MNNLDRKYTELLQDIIENGYRKGDRTGTGTISVFGRMIRHKMSEGFPLLTTKKMAWKQIVTELLWFLRGSTNIQPLVQQGNYIWVGDAYKRYVNWYEEKNYSETPLNKSKFIEKIKTDGDFAEAWGELGPIYGKQWRDWGSEPTRIRSYDKNDPASDIVMEGGIDQIQKMLDFLVEDPDSRRIMVNSWNVKEIDKMVLPPCHYTFQAWTRELTLEERCSYWAEFNEKDISFTKNLDSDKLDTLGVPSREISLMWNQRSVDTFLGLPFNIASYGILLEILAKITNMVPGEVIGSLGDVHLYLNHLDQAKEQMGRDLSEEEKYNLWFNRNYETGMERHFDPKNLPDYDNEYYEKTPTRTREPYELPKLDIKLHFKNDKPFSPEHWLTSDFVIDDYKSHPPIKAEISN